ncbi:MAG: hypothetical protein AB8G23_15610 [Myxococcota bacterium]
MAIKIVPYTADRVPSVQAFNQRMLEGETGWGWYEWAEDDWMPPREGAEIWREHHVAIDDEGEVRGAFALKPQPWLIRGEIKTVTDWQGPVSEGLLSRKYATLGLRMIRDMLKKYPLLYSWGHGGNEGAMLQLLVTLKWLIHETPFCLKVRHPFRFLRRNRYLRNSARNRIALDLLAFTGAGWLGFKLLHFALGLGKSRDKGLETTIVDEFGDWADVVWKNCSPAYQALGLRDAETMNRLVPKVGWPGGIRLRIRRGGEDIGWAVVLDNALENDPRFGDLRVGCVADCLALPQDTEAVLSEATRFLEARGVDMIGSNQSHPAWVEGFKKQGYLILADRRCFAASPALQEAMAPFDETKAGLHLTNMDGHGPHGF